MSNPIEFTHEEIQYLETIPYSLEFTPVEIRSENTGYVTRYQAHYFEKITTPDDVNEQPWTRWEHIPVPLNYLCLNDYYIDFPALSC